MKSSLIHDTRHFRLVSYGNGLAYALERKGVSYASILFQGDDADKFREELDNLSSGRLMLATDDVLRILWNDYECVAEPVAETKSSIAVAWAREHGMKVVDLPLSSVTA